jgi:hypothetical protein
MLTHSAFSNPYIYSVVPLAPAPGASNPAAPTSAIQIHLAPTLSLRQTLPIPAPPAGGLSFSALVSLTTATGPTSPAAAMASSAKMLLVSTPTDKTLVASEGSTVWGLEAGDVGEQVDELIREGRVGDAIGLVESVGEAGLSPVCPTVPLASSGWDSY